MSVHENLTALKGDWKAINRLNMSWMPDPIKESPSTATVSTRVGGQCIEIAYKWQFEGQPQEGLLVVCGDGKSDAVSAVWTDSWHSANILMTCEGKSSDDGGINIKGFYKVQDHPDWGWRTEILPTGDSFKYLMFNVTPDGEEEWAVEMEFTRA